MKISACLVVYNDEKYIDRCLNSLKDAVDEIVVIHDGSCNDRTLEICKKYNAKIFIRDHAGTPETHRPFSFSQASGDWILRIDADEYLSEELKNNLRSLINNSSVDAYELSWPIWNGKKYLTKQWPYKRCLLKKDKFSFLGTPHHNIANVDGEVKKCNLKLMHQPDYDGLSWRCFKSKWVKNARAQANGYFFNYEEIAKFNCSETDWPLKMKLRKKYPMMLIPFEFIITLAKDLSTGGYKEFFIGYKSALFKACYRVLVNYYIFLNKMKQ